MTEQKCIEKLNMLNDALNENFVEADECSCALQLAIKALEEIQQYRALGTVEELRVARDKQVGKKMIIRSDNGTSRKSCGNCACFVLPASKYCSKCGQKLDWSDEDDRA